MTRFLSRIKALVVPSGSRVRPIQFGVFRGLKMDLDLQSQTQIYAGLFERELYDWIYRLAKHIRTGIDAGAGQGEYTLYFLARTMAEHVYAFEPGLEARQKVLKNINANLIEPRTRLEFSAKYLGAANSDNACTLDSLASSIVGPCFIKIDVDGGEADILRGATRILKLAGVRWLIETHSQKLEQECVELLGRTGYKVIIVHQAWWRRFVPELRPGVHNQWLIATQSEDVI